MLNMFFDDKINKILIPFDCLFDTDIGVFRVISKHYANNSVFNLELLNKDGELRDRLKDYNNPLELVIRDDYKHKANDFYLEFLTKEMKKINLESMPIKQMIDFVSKIEATKMGLITFIAIDDTQKEILQRIFNNPVIKGNYESIDVKGFDIVFVKRLSNANFFKNVEGKYIYTFDYSYNVDRTNPTNPLPLIHHCIDLIEKNNSIKVLSLVDNL